jgi:hypothetical protein
VGEGWAISWSRAKHVKIGKNKGNSQKTRGRLAGVGKRSMVMGWWFGSSLSGSVGQRPGSWSLVSVSVRSLTAYRAHTGHRQGVWRGDGVERAERTERVERAGQARKKKEDAVIDVATPPPPRGGGTLLTSSDGE